MVTTGRVVILAESFDVMLGFGVEVVHFGEVLVVVNL